MLNKQQQQKNHLTDFGRIKSSGIPLKERPDCHSPQRLKRMFDKTIVFEEKRITK